MALEKQESTTPSSVNVNQRLSPVPIMLNPGDRRSQGSMRIRYLPIDPKYPQTVFTRIESDAPIIFYGFEPLIEAMRREGITNPPEHESWEDRKRRYLAIPEVRASLEANHFEY